MKKIETLAFIVIVLYLLSFAAPLASNFFIAQTYTPTEVGQMRLSLQWVTMFKSILGVLVHIAIGEWLFFVARRERHATPWIWCLFGLFFGLIAVILYYLIKLYESVKPTEAQS